MKNHRVINIKSGVYYLLILCKTAPIAKLATITTVTATATKVLSDIIMGTSSETRNNIIM